MDKLVTVSIVIGLVIVGSIGVFSIYLQQDKAIVEISGVTNPNYHCLEKFDYMQLAMKENHSVKFTDEFKEISSKYFDAGCVQSFRTWMPETHSSWDQLIVSETNLKRNCELYVNGELILKEWEKPVWKEKGCEDFLKQFD